MSNIYLYISDVAIEELIAHYDVIYGCSTQGVHCRTHDDFSQLKEILLDKFNAKYGDLSKNASTEDNLYVHYEFNDTKRIVCNTVNCHYDAGILENIREWLTINATDWCVLIITLVDQSKKYTRILITSSNIYINNTIYTYGDNGKH